MHNMHCIYMHATLTHRTGHNTLCSQLTETTHATKQTKLLNSVETVV